jgi:hypothetical protein
VGICLVLPISRDRLNLSYAATDPPESGKVLAEKIFNRENGEDAQSRMQMVLINNRGRERVREFLSYVKDYGPLIKQLTRFTSPKDIDGTGFLSIEKGVGKTEQFLYLPALRRTRRIVSSQKDQRFVNSDFTYEDLERRAVEDSDHMITGQEKFGNIPCHILESRPKRETESQYSLEKSWVAKGIDIPVYTEYYDKKGNLIKKYKVQKLKKIQDIWTEIEVAMEDLEREHRTILRVISITYNSGLDDQIFTRQNLEKY